jgi:hypothetical protein
MFRRLSVWAVVLTLLGTGIAIAAQPTPVPNSPPDFSSLSFLNGTWHCKQSITGRPGTRLETDTYTMAYDGWQQADHSVSPPFDKARTRDEVGDSWTTYDPTVKLWINQTVDNFGAYGMATSSGWSGNTMTWSGTGLDGTVGHTTMTKVSDTAYTYKTWGNTKKNGPVILQGTGSCTKS